jgi:hypothetical protein
MRLPPWVVQVAALVYDAVVAVSLQSGVGSTPLPGFGDPAAKPVVPFTVPVIPERGFGHSVISFHLATSITGLNRSSRSDRSVSLDRLVAIRVSNARRPRRCARSLDIDVVSVSEPWPVVAVSEL